jgi:periplasmic copper chaperone A
MLPGLLLRYAGDRHSGADATPGPAADRAANGRAGVDRQNHAAAARQRPPFARSAACLTLFQSSVQTHSLLPSGRYQHGKNPMAILDLRTVSRGAVALTALAFAPLLATHAAAAGYHVGSLQITQTWARATPQGADSGAAYMTVTNTGAKPEKLSCVSSPASAKCQIHEMSMDNGVMKMREVEGGLNVKPGETITFKPGGYHLMLVDLKAPLQQGKSVDATLKVDNGGTAEIEFPIAAIGAPAPGASAGGGMQMQMQSSGAMMQMK